MALCVTTIALAETKIGDLYYNLYSKTLTATVAKYPSSSEKYKGSVTIPSKFIWGGNQYTVTSIGNKAFEDCDELTSITIPNTLTKIGDYAFIGCKALTTIDIPNGVTTIGSFAFHSCYALTTVTIPEGVKTLGTNTFCDCKNLSSINLPSTLESIGTDCFTYTALTSFELPKGVKNVGDFMLYGCTQLTSLSVNPENNVYDSRNNCNAIIETASNKLVIGIKVSTIPEGVTTIGNKAFQGCKELTSIDLPNSLTLIGNRAFYECDGLTSVNIPENVTNIYYEAFAKCKNLTTIYIPSSVTELSGAFQHDSAVVSLTVANPYPISIPASSSDNFPFKGLTKAKLYVPVGSKYAYQAAQGWSYFQKRTFEILQQQTLSYSEIPSSKYGDAAISLPQKTDQGLTINWTSSNSKVATISSNTLTIVGAGTATITATQGGNDEYESFTKTYNLTVAKAPLKITANDCVRFVGEENPVFTLTYEGFVNGDDANSLTKAPKITCVATAESAPGTYTIKVSEASSPNYNITYVNGTLTVLDVTTFNNTLYSETVEIRTGSNASISIELINEDPIVMVEFFMLLPDGISISVDEDGYWDATLNSSRSNRHNIEVEKNSNGLYHFLVYSSRNNSFKGNEGELININIECDENVEKGTYQAILKNILLNNSDKEEIVLPDYNIPIHVTDVLLGDINGDTKINGSDIVELVDHIMGRTSDRFIAAAAELTGDGQINGSDLVEEISLVMSQGVSHAPVATKNYAPRLFSSGLTLKGDSIGAAVLGVESDESFILSQLQIELSEGLILTKITTDAHHSVEYLQLSENTYNVLCYSTSNAVFGSNKALLTIHYTGKGVVSVKDMMMVDNNRMEWYFTPVRLDDVTGIAWDNRTLSQPADIYSINGYLVRQQSSSLEGLTKGVYIVNGNKIIVK